MAGHDMARYALKTRGSMEHLFILITMGDLLGIPILPPYYSLRLLPYVVPQISTWKRRMLREKDLTEEKEKRIIERMFRELGADDVAVQHSLALVMIVGEGMRQSVGTTARATTALAAAKVNLEMINQGSSEVSMMFGVKAAEADRAVIALYQEFFGDEGETAAELLTASSAASVTV